MRSSFKVFAATTAILLSNISFSVAEPVGGELEISKLASVLVSVASTPQPLIYLDQRTGKSWKYNESTKAFDPFSEVAPELPTENGWVGGVAVLTEDNSINYVVNVVDSSGAWRILKIVYSNGSWGSWQTLVDNESSHPRVVLISYGVSAGHDVVFFARTKARPFSAKVVLGTNVSGSWRELTLKSAEFVDDLSTAPVFSGQIAGTADITYQPVVYPFASAYEALRQNSVLHVKNGKVGFVGFVKSDVSAVKKYGHNFTKKSRYFTQIISLNPLKSVKRTLLGSAEVYAADNDFAQYQGEVTNLEQWRHWNAAGNDVVVTVSREIGGLCNVKIDSFDRFAHRDGTCVKKAQIVQFEGSKTNVVAEKEFLYGQQASFRYSERNTSEGMYGLVDYRSRDTDVSSAGYQTAVKNSLNFGWKMIKAKPNGFLPRTAIKTSKGSSDHASYTEIREFRGIAAALIFQCTITSRNSCAMKVEYVGEGKDLLVQTDYARSENSGSVVSEVVLISTGEDWLVQRTSFQTQDNPLRGIYNLKSGEYIPHLALLDPAVHPVVQSMNKGKSTALAVTTKQFHAVTWSVATSSKQICSISLTKKYGAVTKATLKGLKKGTCTLTAKAGAGFFYKALNKTVTVKVK
ncbi:MAG: hypothetical protein RL410_36 [Actinomycetota bacterium]